MHRGTQRTYGFYAKMKRPARLALEGGLDGIAGHRDKASKAYIFVWASIPYAMRKGAGLAERRKARALRRGSSARQSPYTKLHGAITGGRENVDENGDSCGVDRSCHAQCRGQRRAGL